MALLYTGELTAYEGTDLSGSMFWTTLVGASAYEIAKIHGFDGTEEEWIASLRYDHSEEFTRLSNTVLNAAIEVEKNKSTVEVVKESVLVTKAHVDQVSEKMHSDVDHIDNTINVFDQSVESMYKEMDNIKEAFNADAKAANDAINAYMVDAVNAKNDAQKAANVSISAKDESLASENNAKISEMNAKKYLDEIIEFDNEVENKIQTKGDYVLASIPENYNQLLDKVDDVKSDLGGMSLRYEDGVLYAIYKED